MFSELIIHIFISLSFVHRFLIGISLMIRISLSIIELIQNIDYVINIEFSISLNFWFFQCFKLLFDFSCLISKLESKLKFSLPHIWIDCHHICLLKSILHLSWSVLPHREYQSKNVLRNSQEHDEDGNEFVWISFWSGKVLKLKNYVFNRRWIMDLVYRSEVCEVSIEGKKWVKEILVKIGVPSYQIEVKLEILLLVENWCSIVTVIDEVDVNGSIPMNIRWFGDSICWMRWIVEEKTSKQCSKSQIKVKFDVLIDFDVDGWFWCR